MARSLLAQRGSLTLARISGSAHLASGSARRAEYASLVASLAALHLDPLERAGNLLLVQRSLAAAVTAERFALSVGGAAVVGVLHRARPAGQSPCVVACHGMGASKDSDKYLLLGRELPAAGLALARFDFRGSGESGGAYQDATIASRIADLEAVIGHLSRHPLLNGRFGLLGSSLGGFVALWVAARAQRAGAVVTWNAPASLHDLAAQGGAEAPAAGVALIAELRAGRHAEAPAGVERLLVIQGGSDEVVPPTHGHALLERARPPRELCMIEGADHRLSHPAHRLQALERSREWLLRYLGGASVSGS